MTRYRIEQTRNGDWAILDTARMVYRKMGLTKEQAEKSLAFFQERKP